MISDVAFIVIAKNEEFAVDKCLASIATMPLRDCEVICVDSDSSDNTLNIMLSYKDRIENLKVFKCTGFVNSAVARNAGLKYATRKYVFFVDGDVELKPGFIAEAVSVIESGKADVVTGKLPEVYYNNSYSKVIRRVEDRRNIIREHYLHWTGGIFLTTKELVARTGKFDIQLIRNQDMDFTLRLSRYAKILAIPTFMGTHHTLEYHQRSWIGLRKGYPLFFGILIRRNIDRPQVLIELMKKNRGYLWGYIFWALTLLIGVSVAIALLPPSYFSMPLILIVLDMLWGVIRNKNIASHFSTHYVHSLLSLFGLAWFTKSDQHQKTKIIPLIIETEYADHHHYTRLE